MEAIFKRISVRKYQDKAVEPEKIEQILRAAMAAPSAGNQQPWEYIVVTDPDTIQALADCSPFAAGARTAPVVIVPCFRTEGLKYDDCTELDLAITTEHILLEATHLGLGSVWLALAPRQARVLSADAVLGIGDKLHAFALVPIGYAAEERPQEDRFDESRIHYVR